MYVAIILGSLLTAPQAPRPPQAPPARTESPVYTNAAIVYLTAAPASVVYIDGRRIDHHGGLKTLRTPALEPGRPYWYRVEWMDAAGQWWRRDVRVAAGESVNLDLCRLVYYQPPTYYAPAYGGGGGC